MTAEEQLAQLVANSKTGAEIPNATTINDSDYFFFYVPGVGFRKILKSDFLLPGEAATTFKGLSDTPGNYLGQAGKAVIVNPGESGLDFKTIGEIVNLTKEDIETILTYVPVKSVNGNLPDASGNVTVQTGSTANANIRTIEVPENELPAAFTVQDVLDYLNTNGVTKAGDETIRVVTTQPAPTSLTVTNITESTFDYTVA